MDFWAQLIIALQLGSIYALIALGYNMVYGITRLINFAHGDLIMIGGYTAFYILSAVVSMSVPWWVAILVVLVGAALITMIIGVLIEKIAYQPLLKRGAPRMSLLITTLAVGMLLENAVMVFISPAPKSIALPVPKTQIAGISLSALLTLVITIALTALLFLFINRTRMGKAMRAVSEDETAAKLMGINVNTTIMVTFAIGSALAGISAVFYCMAYPQISPTMGVMPGLKAFVAAVLGGIGSVPGAIVGAYVLGILETFARASGLSAWSDAIVFGLLIVVLLFLPAGLLGKNVREKV